jgi:hypothetical protein
MPVWPLALLDVFVVLVMLSIGLRVSGGELIDVLRVLIYCSMLGVHPP